MMIKTKKLAIAAVALIGLSFLAAGCGNGAKAGPPAGPQAFPVKVITAQAQMVPLSTDYLATLKVTERRHAPALGGRRRDQDLCVFWPAGGDGRAILEIDPRKQQATVNNQEARLKSKQAVLQQAALTWTARRNFPPPG